MKRRRALVGIAAIAAGIGSLRAQAKPARVVVLHAGSSNEAASQQREPFEHSLRERGLTPGSTVLIVYRYAEGREERLSDLARNIAQSKPAVIVARGPAVVRAVQGVTKTLPVVALFSGDPVAEGLIKSLARPGGNITGVVVDNFAYDQKRLELLKEAFPRARRVAIIVNPHFDGDRFDQRMAVIHDQARTLKLQPETFKATTAGEINAAFVAIAKFKADGLLLRPDPQLIDRSRSQIITLAAKYRLPAVYPWRFFVDSGGLISYSPHFAWLHSQSAVYVSRILKGEKPSEMPVEQAARQEMVVNLGTAKALGIEIPKTVLFRADAVVN
jgi:putative tryptophan/tyrosine transport system substrate-binding protein